MSKAIGNAKPVALAIVRGTVANVTKGARKASKVNADVYPTPKQLAQSFAAYVEVDGTLQNIKALWDVAREDLRIGLAKAHKVLKGGKAWDNYKAETRGELVALHVCADTNAAGRLIRNACIALSITGTGARKGGKPKGKGGRPETTDTGEHETLSDKAVAFRMTAALAKLAEGQTQFAGDDDVLAFLGEVCAILGGGK